MRTGPYGDASLDKIYEMLFCDDASLYRPDGAAATEYPWKELAADDVTDKQLEGIVNDPEVETRLRLVASRLLLGRGVPARERRLLGVIVEVAMDEGLDVLAAYEDGTARYINYSGKLIVWDAATPESDALVKAVFAAAGQVVGQIGPWEGERLPAPVVGNARLSFLVTDGLYFGEGPLQALAQDALGGGVINSGAALMGFLVKHALAHSA
jgi:hypothetical protein